MNPLIILGTSVLCKHPILAALQPCALLPGIGFRLTVTLIRISGWSSIQLDVPLGSCPGCFHIRCLNHLS